MGYLFLCLALLAGLTKGYCGKRTSGYTAGLREALAANTIRMVLCILVGFVLIWAQSNLEQLAVSGKTLAISALSGVATAVFVVSWLLAVKQGAYMLVEVFLMLGEALVRGDHSAAKLDSAQLYPLNQGAALILSMGMSAVFFKEKVMPKAILGIVLAFLGLLVMNLL